MASPSRSLLPKEHGAYAQLAFPLLTGLALSFPSPAALALGMAAVAFFLANEPVAVLLGTRGKRLKDGAGDRAKGRAALLLSLGAVLGLVGVWRGGAAVWPELAFPVSAAILLIPVVLAGRQKSLPGEILVITGFSTLLLPLAAASGVPTLKAALAAGVWWLSFCLGTLEVHAIKARIKPTAPKQWTRWGSPLAATVVLAGATWMALGQLNPILEAWSPGGAPGALADGGLAWAAEARRLLPPAAAALLPPAVAVLLVSFLRVHPRRLKRVGWTLVGANALALVLLLQG